MVIGGFQRFSLIDYPGKICATIFTQGCNFRCPYCHNPELVNARRSQHLIPEEDVFSFLEKRRNKLDAVVITGGEPILQADLLEFLEKIKTMGYLTKLDTNGSDPRVIEKIIDRRLADYLAMDVKAPLEKYQEITNSNIDCDEIKQSIRLIMHSGIDYEFRTTIVTSQLSEENILEIGKLIRGAKLYILQKFVPSKVVDPKFLNELTFSDGKLKALQNTLKDLVVQCVVR
jgi:pyruvate formate lyase activating enzyme